MRKREFALGILALAFAWSAEGVVRHVSAVSGNDMPSGGGPGSPYATIQYAVDHAGYGDTIRIAAYEFSGGVTNPCVYTSPGVNVISLTGGRDLMLQGGFAFNPMSSIWTQVGKPALVDGEGVRQCLYAADPNSTNRVRLLEFANGGVSVHGGNVYVDGGRLEMRGTPIHGGTAVGRGGGIYIKNGTLSLDLGGHGGIALPELSGLLPVYSNSASEGGGIYIDGGEAILTAVGIYRNSAGSRGGGLYVEGGMPTLAGADIRENTAAAEGGGVYLSSSLSRIAGANVISNQASEGGGVYVDGPFAPVPGSAALLANNVVRGNAATGGAGGGVYLARADIGLVNNIIANNTATNGAGLYLYAAAPRLFQNTIADNTGETGIYVTHSCGDGEWIVVSTPLGTFSNYVAGIPVPSRPALTNTIVTGHATALHVDDSGNTVLQNQVNMGYTLWWDNTTDIEGGGTVVHDHDVYADPVYTCTGMPPGCVDAYHLSAGSPAVDTGAVVSVCLPGTDLLLDIDGQLRPSGDGMDLGADERVAVGSYSAWFVPGGYTRTVRAGDVFTNEYYLLNSGDQADTYTLSSSNSLVGWVSDVTPTNVALGGQSYTTIEVATAVPGGATHGDENVGTLTAVSGSDTGRTAVAVDLSTVTSNTYLPVTRYVWPDSPNPTNPYTSRATAGHDIQTVVDASQAGDTILVAPGIYDSGAVPAPGYALSNRVHISKAVTVHGEGGPANTFIVGASDNGTNGAAAVRCLYVDNGAQIEGFTLTGGFTDHADADWRERAGGGAYILNGQIADCRVCLNVAQDVGGGIRMFEGVVSRCLLEDNQGKSGGGLYMSEHMSGQTEVRHCVLQGNQALQGGGGISARDGGEVHHCTIAGNTAGNVAGGVYLLQGVSLQNCLIVSNHASSYAGVSLTQGGSLTNCTVVGNDTEDGSCDGVRLWDGGSLVNCIVWGNGNDDIQNDNGGPILYTCARDGVTNGVNGCITSDPLFEDAAAGVYRLQRESPCKDAGDDGSAAGTTDLDGLTRIAGAAVDMGCYENQAGVEHADPSPTHYTATNGIALWPFTNRTTAARTIQDAVDAAVGGDTVRVDAGVYDRGAVVAPGYALSNRVYVSKAITLHAEAGPSNTVIVGASDGGRTGPAAVRCVLMDNGGRLDGFAVTGGFTHDNAGGDAGDRRGGGVYADENSVITNCWIRENMANTAGGGVYLDSSRADSCQVLLNSLDGDYGAPYGLGVYCYHGVLQDCTISSNTMTGTSYGGGVFVWYSGTLRRCRLIGNETRGGAGLSMYRGGLATRCVFRGNAATFVGAGVQLSQGGALENCLIEGNRGGAVYLYEGGALTNCTVTGNDTSDTSTDGVVLTNGGSLVNCIVWGNGDRDIEDGNGGPILYTCARDGVTNGVNGCITNEPGFIDAGAKDYRLGYGSACVDSGTNLLGLIVDDLDGEDRPIDGNFDGPDEFDMGCYEYNPALSDMDKDGLSDLDEVVDFGTSPTNVNTDGDGHDDYQEWIADTDGTDSNDYFRITAIAQTNSWRVWFNCSSNRLYSLAYIDSLTTDSWSYVEGQTNRAGETDGVMFLTDSSNALFRCYRVLVGLP